MYQKLRRGGNEAFLCVFSITRDLQNVVLDHQLCVVVVVLDHAAPPSTLVINQKSTGCTKSPGY